MTFASDTTCSANVISEHGVIMEKSERARDVVGKERNHHQSATKGNAVAAAMTHKGLAKGLLLGVP